MINFFRVRDKLEQVEVERKHKQDVNELKAEVARLTHKGAKDGIEIFNLKMSLNMQMKYNDDGADHNKVLIKEIARLKDELARERYIYGRALADVASGEAIITAVFRHSGDYDRTNS